MTPLTTGLRADFDQETKPLPMRVAGRLTDGKMLRHPVSRRRARDVQGTVQRLCDVKVIPATHVYRTRMKRFRKVAAWLIASCKWGMV
jgi:hypothetical protein